jgi:hypothetical protein
MMMSHSTLSSGRPGRSLKMRNPSPLAGIGEYMNSLIPVACIVQAVLACRGARRKNAHGGLALSETVRPVGM